MHYVVKGEGMRFIGDNISNFRAGELVLLGENLPHKWRTREDLASGDADPEFEAIVIHFLPECLGRDFLHLPETHLIPGLYENAKKGMFIVGETKVRLANLMYSALKAQGLERLIVLLSMLKLLAENREFTPIASAHAFYRSNEQDIIRLNKIHEYTLSNYNKEISLEDIAALSNLSLTSFCRYFKLMTRKTYHDFLTEVRISHACRMLVEDKLATEVICYECGFNNVSNFFRHFKKVTGTTPLKYKRQYLFN